MILSSARASFLAPVENQPPGRGSDPDLHGAGISRQDLGPSAPGGAVTFVNDMWLK